MSCDNCESNRIARISSKSRDLHNWSYGALEHKGYLPEGLGIGDDDYVAFDYCLDCGTIQDFPGVSDETLKEVFELDELPLSPTTDLVEMVNQLYDMMHNIDEVGIEFIKDYQYRAFKKLVEELQELNVIPEGMINPRYYKSLSSEDMMTITQRAIKRGEVNR